MAIKMAAVEFMDAISLAYWVNHAGLAATVVQIVHAGDRFVLFTNIDTTLIGSATFPALVDQGDGRGWLRTPGTPA